MNIGYEILKWYSNNKRDLPWRQTKNPYFIWVSEIIMQQTRIVQGLPYYQKFIRAFPNIKSLADSNEESVLHLWQGLGYYSRARNMHTTAKYIQNERNGQFPNDYSQILELKGIGKYTASAIASFCFNEAVPAIDGNVYRVFSRLFDVVEPIDKRSGQKIIEELSKDELVLEDPGNYNQAMMDFGAMICTPQKPNCMHCPVSEKCLALKNNTIALRPNKSIRTKVRKRYFNYLVFSNEKQILIQQRTANDVWKNLFEFPLIESEKELTQQELMDVVMWKEFGVLKDPIIDGFVKMKPHKLSHQHIYSQFLIVKLTDDRLFQRGFWIKYEQLTDYPFSKLIANFVEKYLT